MDTTQRGPIVLLTDFGQTDGYVGVMKGVIATLCPTVGVIDLTHGIEPQQVRAASLCLAQSYAYFPVGSIFLCVVDPGVGSDRRAIAVAFAGGYYVGPDNGLGTPLWQTQTINQTIQCVTLTKPKFWWSATVSGTFHGRDIFAPVAAHLARGVPLTQLGEPFDPQTLVSLPPLPFAIEGERVTGVITAVDHFGNLITNIPAACLPQNATVYYQNRPVPLVSHYGAQASGAAIALIGSHGYVEIAVNGGHAQSLLQAQVGDPVTVLGNNGESS